MDAHAELLGRLIRRENLSADEAGRFFDAVFDGAVEPAMLAAVLTALAAKGEAADEVIGAARAMRARVTPIRLPPNVDAVDTCGSGGDGKPTFNVSSCVAIVAAACGATVAKHGNRSNLRPSGSAEALAALGVNVDAPPTVIERCLREHRVAFLYAAQLHPAMKAAAPVRRALGVRTIFNLVGPLTNPAGVRRQLLGVNRPELVPLMLGALRELGCDRAMVVHGREGLCDISVSGPTLVGQWDGHRQREFEVAPGEVGLAAGPLEALFVRDPAHSAAVIQAVLRDEPGPPRDIVLLNAAATLWAAGRCDDLRDGLAAAREALGSGAAAATLKAWARSSNKHA